MCIISALYFGLLKNWTLGYTGIWFIVLFGDWTLVYYRPNSSTSIDQSQALKFGVDESTVLKQTKVQWSNLRKIDQNPVLKQTKVKPPVCSHINDSVDVYSITILTNSNEPHIFFVCLIETFPCQLLLKWLVFQIRPKTTD